MLASRAFEYTSDELLGRFKPGGVIAVPEVLRLPALFLQESSRGHDPVAHVGSISRMRFSQDDIVLEYLYDPGVPPLLNSRVEELAGQLDIGSFEFSRTHWAIKDVDLFHILLVNLKPSRSMPRVFQISDPERIEHTLVSVMMPFGRNLTPCSRPSKKPQQGRGFTADALTISGTIPS
jgi:hypothetical protein